MVEHVYAPRAYATCGYNLLWPNGYALISTPYHGHLKNGIAMAGKMNKLFKALLDHGYITGSAPKTPTQLLPESRLQVVRVYRVGSISQLARKMVVVAHKPDHRSQPLQ